MFSIDFFTLSKNFYNTLIFIWYNAIHWMHTNITTVLLKHCQSKFIFQQIKKRRLRIRESHCYLLICRLIVHSCFHLYKHLPLLYSFDFKSSLHEWIILNELTHLKSAEILSALQTVALPCSMYFLEDHLKLSRFI